MDHDHNHDTHTLNCPICTAPIGVHAHDDEQAIQSLVEARKQHFQDAGHDGDMPSDEEIEKSTRELVQKAQ